MNPNSLPPGTETMIAVKNLGCPLDPDLDNPTLQYGGTKSRFPKNQIVEIPLSIAYYHFAIEINPTNGQLMRDDRDEDDKGEETWFHNRLASLEPKGLMDYGTGQFANRHADVPRFNAWKEWFRNGIEFAVIPTQLRVSEESFDKLKARQPLVQPRRRERKLATVT